MDYTVSEWDMQNGKFITRAMTPQEINEVQGRVAAVPPIVPTQVPMLNAHLVLIQDGKMQLLLDLVQQLDGPDRLEAQAYLNLAQTCRRNNKWVVQLGEALGYGSADLDQLFRRAGQLNP